MVIAMFDAKGTGEDWRAEASCRGIEIDQFFKPNISRDVRAACRECPVRDECLNHALLYEEFGYWGGTNPKERVAMRRSLGIKPKYLSVGRIIENKVPDESELMPIEHGTRSGYQLHVKRNMGFELPNGEDCGCRAANAAHIKAYRIKKREEQESQ